MYTSYPEKGFQSLHRRMSFSLSGAAAAAAMGGSAALASLQKHQFKKGYYEGSSEETENLQFDQQHARHHEEQNWILEFDGYDPKTEGIREALLTLGNGVFATRGACEMSSSHATVSSNKDDESTKAHTAAQDKTQQQQQQPTIGLPPPVTSCHYAGTYFNGYFNRSDSKVSDRYITNEDLVNFPNWLPITFKIMGEKQQVVQLEKKTTSPPVRSSPAERPSIGAAAAATTTASIPPYEPATTLQPTTQEFVENQQEEQKQLQQELIEHLKNMSTNSAQLQAKVLDEEQAALTKTETATQGSSAAKQQSAATDEEDQWTTLENCKRIDRYKQWLNLKEGVLYRKLTIVDHKDRITTITTRRFVHMGGSHIGCIDFAITPENWSGEFHIRCSIDASVCNNGVARYRNLNAYHFDTVDIGHERFANSTDTIAFATVLTRQSHIEVATAQRVRVFMNEIQCTPHENYTVNAARNVIHCDLKLHAPPLHQHNGDEDEEDEDYDDENFEAQKTEEAANGYSPKTRRARERRTFHIEKVCSLVGSKDFGITNVKNNAVQMLSYIPNFEVLLNQHKTAWEMLWTRMDTIITPKTALEDDNNEAADTKAKQQGNDVEKNKNKNTNTTTVEEPTTTTTTITETKSSESTRENNLSKSSVRESTTSTSSTETNNNNNTLHNKHKKKKHKPIIEQIILRLHTFHCLQVLSTNSLDRDVSVPARGIHGESYRGHIFWDELYIMPFFTTKLPEVARLIPKYRYKRINMARINAIKKGLHGALFPWQSGSDGQEETQQIHLNPLTQQWGPDLSSAQYHGNIAIAYNILRYFDLTRDVGFMEDFGAEIVLEIAKMFASLARYNHETERYDIVGVMGPDEYHESFPGSSEQGLRNNAYTNVMVVWLLNRSYELLKNIRSVFRKKITHTLNITDEVLRRWRDISHNMFVPFHYFTPSHSSAAAASASTGGASNPTFTTAATTGSSTAAAASGTTATASTATTATTSTSGHSRKKLIMSQFEGYEHLKELDWEHYRSKYQSIGRMDRILKAENDTPDHYKVSKQADVCMLFYLLTPKEIHDLMKLLGYEITDSFIPDNVEYYMNRTCHGSTLSYLVHAAILYGIDANKSWDFFIQALNSDYNDIQGGTTQEGIHMAIMAGTVDLVMHKFAGLDMTRDALSLNPCIPGQLAEIQFYLHWRNDIVQLRITHDFLEIKFEDEYKMPSSSSSSNLRMRTKDKGTGKGDEDNGEAVIVPIFLHGQLFAVSKSRKSKLSIDSCTFCGPYYLCAKCHKHIGKNHDHHVCRICSKVYCPTCTETEASNKLKLEQFKHVVKPVRCCNSCFETVKEIPVAPRV